jgi:hypothetical protein
MLTILKDAKFDRVICVVVSTLAFALKLMSTLVLALVPVIDMTYVVVAAIPLTSTLYTSRFASAVPHLYAKNAMEPFTEIS